MRISVPLVLIFVWAGGTFEPNILMTKHMSVEVPFVLKTSTASLVFTHITEFCLVCDLMLLQSAFEWEALTTILTNKMKVIMKVHYACQVKIVLQIFCYIAHNQQSRGPSYDAIDIYIFPTVHMVKTHFLLENLSISQPFLGIL